MQSSGRLVVPTLQLGSVDAELAIKDKEFK
jgi:hypothetical protein